MYVCTYVCMYACMRLIVWLILNKIPLFLISVLCAFLHLIQLRTWGYLDTKWRLNDYKCRELWSRSSAQPIMVCSTMTSQAISSISAQCPRFSIENWTNWLRKLTSSTFEWFWTFWTNIFLRGACWPYWLICLKSIIISLCCLHSRVISYISP
jgi:hypothetical protein